jgi:RNase P subunit RPR2
MAVCWQCPSCSAISCEDDVNAEGKPLACDQCERAFLPVETLCPVCAAPNPWSRRDTIRLWCRSCGEVQRFLTGFQVSEFQVSK